MKHTIYRLLLLVVLLGALTLTVWTTDAVQTDLHMTLGSDESQRNFTWHTEQDEAGSLYLAPQSQLTDGQLPGSAAQFPASMTEAGDGFCHQVTVTGLQPDTAYAYQLVNGAQSSPVYTFTTQPKGDFTFAFAGDPQINDGEDMDGWRHTLSLITEQPLFADTAFLLSAGDQVDDGEEAQYDMLLAPEALRSLPFVTTIGNHDKDFPAYGQHFHIPNESDRYGLTAAGGDSWFVYNDVLFFVLNSNNRSTPEHQAFMEAALAENLHVRWRIVVMHHSLYTVADHAEDKHVLERREELVPLFEQLGIDLVLMGHDHVYCRTYLMDGLTPVTDPAAYDNADRTAATDPQGILYLTANSSTGSKHYDPNGTDYPYVAVQNQEDVPNITRIAVTDQTLSIATYRTTDLRVMDQFTIRHTRADGCPSRDFTDVPEDAWYHSAVDFALDQGLMRGDGGPTFDPQDTLTRAMLVQILYNRAGRPVVQGEQQFDDVPQGTWYYRAVSWAAKEDIVRGYADGTFRPEEPCTREQIVTFFWRYAGMPDSQGTEIPFDDGAQVHTYARRAVIWAAETGLVQGMGHNRFVPDGLATRAQGATLLQRMVGW